MRSQAGFAQGDAIENHAHTHTQPILATYCCLRLRFSIALGFRFSFLLIFGVLICLMYSSLLFCFARERFLFHSHQHEWWLFLFFLHVSKRWSYISRQLNVIFIAVPSQIAEILPLLRYAQSNNETLAWTQLRHQVFDLINDFWRNHSTLCWMNDVNFGS